jgi:hypothetical protein
MKEIWKNIPGYEGLYQASNLGRIKALSRYKIKFDGYHGITKEKIMNQFCDRRGYCRIGLTNGNNKRKTYSVHRLILSTFHTEDNVNKCAMHLDDNQTNNNIQNLKWGTLSENSKQIYDHNRRKIKGDYSPNHKLTEDQAERILFLKDKVERGYWSKLARALNVHQSTISNVLTGKHWGGVSSRI